MKSLRFFAKLCLFLALFAGFALPRPALAIGPGTGGSKIRVSDEKVGPYVLLVATSPLPVTVGQMNVWVRVSDGQTSQLRREAVVMVEATLRGGGPTVTAQASHKNAGNDYDYVAHLPEVQAAGQWDVKILVQDELGQAEVSFVETVTQGVSLNVVVGLAVPFIVLAIVVGIYMWRRSGKGGEEK